MNYSEFTFTDKGGKEVHAYKWQPECTPKAVIQFAHGMQEHALRYSDFAETMVSEGYIVYAHDHRGHGKTAGDYSKLGVIDSKKGSYWLVEDVHELSEIIRKENPGLALFVAGHSMGSFVVRDFASKYGNTVDGIILSGTRSEPLFLVKIGLFFCKLLVLITGHSYKNLLFTSITLKKWCKRIKNPKTLFDWLNRDEKQVATFVQDKYCGFACTQGFYRDLLNLLVNIYSMKNIRKIPKNLPILFTAGDGDPVGDYGAGVKTAFKHFLKAGLNNVTLKLYPAARHEILKETNKEEVIRDLLLFINKNMPVLA